MLAMMMGGRPIYRVTISSNRGSWIRSIDAPTIPSTQPVLLILTINSGIEVQASSAYAPLGAIFFNSLADGSEVQLVNNGYLIGRGGEGGEGGAGSAGLPGEDGHPAVVSSFSGLLKITNGAGYIWGGGGGGGSGGSYSSAQGGGGGGGGAGGGAGGTAVYNAGTAGTTGRLGAPGAGGAANDASSGAGGTGGTYGAAGAAGGDPLPTIPAFYGGAGGAGGYAVQLVGTTLVWVSGSTRVLGTVGT